MFTGRQLRAARGMVDWTRTECADAAGISPETIKNIEHGVFRPADSTASALIKCFREHGVEFTYTDGEGVRKIPKCPNCGWPETHGDSKEETEPA